MKTLPHATPTFSIVRSTDADAERRLYARLRAPEFAPLGLPAEALSSLLGMQFAAQSAQIEADYPAAVRELVVADGLVAARLITASSPSTLRLIDIAVLPELRGAGLGTRILGLLGDRADSFGQHIRLSARSENTGAIRLYTRLGFQPDLGLRPDENTGGYVSFTRPAGASILERTA